MKKRNVFLLSAVLVCACLCAALVSCELTTPKPEQGTMRMLSIGIDYSNCKVNTKSYLFGTVGDANAIADAFELAAAAATNRDAMAAGDIIRMIQRGQSRTQETINQATYPSKQHIIDQLQHLAETADSKDLTIIYYSGHGNDATGALVTATTDPVEGDIWDGTSIKSEILLTAEELFQKLHAIPGKKLLILDSCFSGNFIPEDGSTINTQDNTQSWNETFALLFSNATAEQQQNLFVVSATSSSLKSYEPGNGKHGFFTQGLLTGLGATSLFRVGETTDGVYAGKFIYNKISSFSMNSSAAQGKTLTLDGLFAYASNLLTVSQRKLQTPQIIRGLYDLVLFTF
ncbi:MAG: caspase family protein [Sphaerochaetaceae bacterium]|nr:caspase family protein [Sphaerochaetaceae bacterium]